MNINNINNPSPILEILKMTDLTIEGIITPIVDNLYYETRAINQLTKDIMIMGYDNQRLKQEYDFKLKLLLEQREIIKEINFIKIPNAQITSHLGKTSNLLRKKDSLLDEDINLTMNYEKKLKIKEAILKALINGENCNTIEEVVKYMKNNPNNNSPFRISRCVSDKKMGLKSCSTSNMIKGTAAKNRSFYDLLNHKDKNAIYRSSRDNLNESAGTATTINPRKIISQSFVTDQDRDKGIFESGNSSSDYRKKNSYNKSLEKFLVFNVTGNFNENEEASLTDLNEDNNSNQRQMSNDQLSRKI